MTTILRTEEWHREEDGMISAAVVNVFEGEVVHLQPSIIEELQLPPTEGVEMVPSGTEYWVFAYPYLAFKDALLKSGMTYAGTT